jgi:hypothetical protein
MKLNKAPPYRKSGFSSCPFRASRIAAVGDSGSPAPEARKLRRHMLFVADKTWNPEAEGLPGAALSC